MKLKSISARLFLFFSISAISPFAQSRLLREYSPYEYKLSFTNPTCAEYTYDETVVSNSGVILKGKPKNAYCKPADETISAEREDSPTQYLLNWINDPSTNEIFFTYLSFSNKRVASALCNAIQYRNVKVTVVLDNTTSLNRANELLNCKASEQARQPTLHLRGHVSGIDFAHNKLFIVNPKSSEKIKIAFGSGNLTSGIVLHHENWHFITTSPKSYFAQSHLCVMQGELNFSASGRDFRKHMKDCLGKISVSPEEDIQPFFVPGAGPAATAMIANAIRSSAQIDIAAHRFSYSKLIQMLSTRLESADGVQLRLVFDDDMYWAGKGQSKGPNTGREFRAVLKLQSLGANIRYVETNHSQHLLHHNKFIVFHGPQNELSVFTGAGNFTGTAFSSNLENFYYIKIPEVTQAMAKQYAHLYFDLGTEEKNLPRKDVSP